MSRTYKATGINLKGMPLGEADRLLTVLTQEHGLIRAVAPGVRKHTSKIGARSGLFVVNELLLLPGKTLDKIIQAETVESYPGISQDLCKLTASQYLAELALCQALSDQPQDELFWLLRDHLGQIERSPQPLVLICLLRGIFHLLAIAGIAPQVHACCMTQAPLDPDLTLEKPSAAFSVTAGGIISLAELEQLEAAQPHPERSLMAVRSSQQATQPYSHRAREPQSGHYRAVSRLQQSSENNPQPLTASQLFWLQQIALPEFLTSRDRTAVPDEQWEKAIVEQPQPQSPLTYPVTREDGGASLWEASYSDWLIVEYLLRQYAQYHFDRLIRSASLIETCFTTAPIQSVPASPG